MSPVRKDGWIQKGRSYRENKLEPSGGQMDGLPDKNNLETTISGHSRYVNAVSYSCLFSNVWCVLTIEHFTGMSRVFPSAQTANKLQVAAGTKAWKFGRRRLARACRRWPDTQIREIFFSVLSSFLLLSSCFTCWLISSKRRVLSVVYNPDDTKIAIGSRDKTLKIWNAQTGQYVSTLTGHSNPWDFFYFQFCLIFFSCRVVSCADSSHRNAGSRRYPGARTATT
jgi:WD40 repeat protein